MRKSTGENKYLPILLGLLAFVLLGAFYYYGVYPKSEAKASTENALVQLKDETNQLENRINLLSETEIAQTDDFELRKKLPINRDLDALLRSINEVELMSEAKIVSIIFNNYDEEVAKSTNFTSAEEEEIKKEEQDNATDAEVEEKVAEEIEETAGTNGEKPVTPIDIESLPEQLKLLSLTIDMVVPNYDHLLRFLEEIESIERVIRIDTVEFIQNGEVDLMKIEPLEEILVSVQLTTFYSEELVE
ncbi:hypothetical protein ACFSFY_04350 [Sporosarcina siberiensis]|uniref:Type IV pilus assembly protein PilO n=1 Tax=Sporosarcina siberiensis TaxID=1365606 RepID=A0ABW4SCV7_9BACL